MQVVRSIVKSQLILLAVQNELAFADTVTPTSDQCRQIRLVSAGQLLNAVVTLDNVSYFTILAGNHNSTNGTAIV